MENKDIIDKLTTLFHQMETKGKHGDTGYIATETKMIAEYAIELIENFQTQSKEVAETKLIAVRELNKAIEQANKYYEKSCGFNPIENRNYKYDIYTFINTAYNALELFLVSSKNYHL